MLNIKDMGSLKGLTGAMSDSGYDLVSMRQDIENNKLTIKYNNDRTTYDYTWEVTVKANIQEEEYGMPTIIDITKVSMENTGKSV